MRGFGADGPSIIRAAMNATPPARPPWRPEDRGPEGFTGAGLYSSKRPPTSRVGFRIVHCRWATAPILPSADDSGSLGGLGPFRAFSGVSGRPTVQNNRRQPGVRPLSRRPRGLADLGDGAVTLEA
jgi:hypothetical protein